MKKWVRTGMAALLLAAGTAGMLMQGSPGKVETVSAGTVLAACEEITVLSGAPEGSEWVCVSRTQLMQGA